MALRLTIGPCQGNSRLPAGGLALVISGGNSKAEWSLLTAIDDESRAGEFHGVVSYLVFSC